MTTGLRGSKYDRANSSGLMVSTVSIGLNKKLMDGVVKRLITRWQDDSRIVANIKYFCSINRHFDLAVYGVLEKVVTKGVN